MIEQLLTFLAGLAVAAAGLVGIGVASGTPQDGDPEFDSAAARIVWAQAQASERRAAADDLRADDLEEVNLTVGTDRALEALEAAQAVAAEEAQEALQHAAEQVAAGGAGNADGAGDAADAADAAPVDVPAGPPAEVPAGAPDGVPSGSDNRP